MRVQLEEAEGVGEMGLGETRRAHKCQNVSNKLYADLKVSETI